MRMHEVTSITLSAPPPLSDDLDGACEVFAHRTSRSGSRSRDPGCRRRRRFKSGHAE